MGGRGGGGTEGGDGGFVAGALDAEGAGGFEGAGHWGCGGC